MIRVLSCSNPPRQPPDLIGTGLGGVVIGGTDRRSTTGRGARPGPAGALRSRDRCRRDPFSAFEMTAAHKVTASRVRSR